MKAIVAVDKRLAIGRSGDLLYRIPSDMKHFRRETLGRTCIMGRKTLESMPKGQPLPGRNTIVLSRNLPEGVFWEKDGFIAAAVGSREAVFRILAEFSLPEAIVCGGEQIYRLFLSDCDELIVTEVDDEAEGADAFFPDFQGEFELREETEPVEDDGIRFKISRYQTKTDKAEPADFACACETEQPEDQRESRCRACCEDPCTEGEPR